MSSRIIVPLDRSHVAECAIPYARALARQAGLPITLLTVLRPSTSLPDPADTSHPAAVEEPGPTGSHQSYSASLPFASNPGSSDFDPDAVDEAMSELAEVNEYLDYVANSIIEADTTTAVEYGEPVDRIVHVAEMAVEQGEKPVIVMASHGRSGLGRVLLGSVALSVAERAECPILVCRAMNSPVPSVDEITLSRILIPLDGSDAAEAVVEPIRTTFGAPGSSVHLLSVVDQERSWWTGQPATRDPDGRTSRDEAEQYLTTMAERLRAHGFSTEWDVVEGTPSDRINTVANETAVDFIAMATHGRSGLERFTVGSVAEDVLNRATRPVLLVRQV